MPTDSDEWRVSTDRSLIEDWARERGLTPVRVGETDPTLDLVSAPGNRDADPISWERFFEHFEEQGLALRFREGARTDDRSAYELVERRSAADDGSTDRADEPPDDGPDGSGRTSEAIGTPAGTDEPDRDEREDRPAPNAEYGSGGSERDDDGLLDDEFADSRRTGDENASKSGEEPDTERMALSDTGDAEPVVEDDIESEGAAERDHGGEEPDAETSMSESARGAERATLVLDEIYEDPGMFGGSADDEYVVFRNTGEEPLDLSNWVVENGAGDAYEFPDGFALGPDERVTLHSDHGQDTEHELHWRSDEPIWDQEGGTVVVRTPGGETVVREPFKG